MATPIKREVTGHKQPVVYIIRAANKKTFREIHHEIRAAQVEVVEQVWEGFKGIGVLPMVIFRLGSISGGVQGPDRRTGWSDQSWLLDHFLLERKHENL